MSVDFHPLDAFGGGLCSGGSGVWGVPNRTGGVFGGPAYLATTEALTDHHHQHHYSTASPTSNAFYNAATNTLEASLSTAGGDAVVSQSTTVNTGNTSYNEASNCVDDSMQHLHNHAPPTHSPSACSSLGLLSSQPVTAHLSSVTDITQPQQNATASSFLDYQPRELSLMGQSSTLSTMASPGCGGHLYSSAYVSAANCAAADALGQSHLPVTAVSLFDDNKALLQLPNKHFGLDFGFLENFGASTSSSRTNEMVPILEPLCNTSSDSVRVTEKLPTKVDDDSASRKNKSELDGKCDSSLPLRDIFSCSTSETNVPSSLDLTVKEISRLENNVCDVNPSIMRANVVSSDEICDTFGFLGDESKINESIENNKEGCRDSGVFVNHDAETCVAKADCVSHRTKCAGENSTSKEEKRACSTCNRSKKQQNSIGEKVDQTICETVSA